MEGLYQRNLSRLLVDDACLGADSGARFDRPPKPAIALFDHGLPGNDVSSRPSMIRVNCGLERVFKA